VAVGSHAERTGNPRPVTSALAGAAGPCCAVFGCVKALRFVPTRCAGAFGGLDPACARRREVPWAPADGCSAGGYGSGLRFGAPAVVDMMRRPALMVLLVLSTITVKENAQGRLARRVESCQRVSNRASAESRVQGAQVLHGLATSSTSPSDRYPGSGPCKVAPQGGL
jgi:hypothetical protein